MNIQKNKFYGFTIIEALIAILITSFIAISIAALITSFGLKTADRILLSCLVEGAASGIEACRGGQTINQITCGGLTVNISITGDCQPAPNTCSNINATASAKGKSLSLTDKVCNFQ